MKDFDGSWYHNQGIYDHALGDEIGHSSRFSTTRYVSSASNIPKMAPRAKLTIPFCSPFDKPNGPPILAGL
ncbi:hypothetical protein BC936DRAFT_141576 [Jimgerdemannia flammicorona]|uniref:Uncharacterized protein n=1 Tax=Jimgerdemannia flammicorona TaxID=994334 RepID=A0A433DNR1_9FUNG|nr:hypothetical protein BC936DRAFT_141576 [Jimgerdemannia flammicorona]